MNPDAARLYLRLAASLDAVMSKMADSGSCKGPHLSSQHQATHFGASSQAKNNVDNLLELLGKVWKIP